VPCIEVTAAQPAVIAGAGGTTRNVSAMSATAGHDQLGEAVGPQQRQLSSFTA
jgi:hypothetical protein